MTHYLIDYENVHEAGLEGLSALDAGSVIHIFYSKNANKINMDFLASPASPPCRFLSVEPGKQQLDMHLVSYLGYLLGTEEAKDARYVIISKDQDYAKVMAFWNARTGQADKVRQQSTISGEEHEPPALPPPPAPMPAPPAKPKAKPKAAKEKAKPPLDKAAERNSSIQKALSKAQADQKDVAAIASLVAKTPQNKQFKQLVYRQIIAKYGMEAGLRHYNTIKQFLKVE